jgi:peptidoglycan/LPS O-acetylase OafA/YrhL
MCLSLRDLQDASGLHSARGRVRVEMEAGEHNSLWQSSRLGYRPALDGVRAFAVGAVLAVHGGLLNGGFFGVDIFFVLSGFLITSLLIEEWVRTDTLSLRAFYARRARRLLPALFLTIAAVGVLYVAFPDLNRGIGFGWAALAAAFYVGNWAEAFHSHGSLGDLGLLTHTWSLAIEEQFYIVWPLLLIVLLRRRFQPRMLTLGLGGLAVASGVLCFLTWERVLGGSAFFQSHTRAIDLLVGCALGTAWASRGGTHQVHRFANSQLVALAAIAGLAVLVATLSPDDPLVYSVGFPIVALCSAVVIAHVVANRGSMVTSSLSMGLIVWVGVRSYGIYLYHLPVFEVLTPSRLHLRLAIVLPIRVLVTLIVAAASYRFVESRFLRRKPYPIPETTGAEHEAHTIPSGVLRSHQPSKVVSAATRLERPVETSAPADGPSH